MSILHDYNSQYQSFDDLQKITSEHSIIASSDVADYRVVLVFYNISQVLLCQKIIMPFSWVPTASPGKC
jgi:hypothetical protein